MARVSRVIHEQERGKLETNVQTVEMGEMEIEKGADSRNSRSMAESEVGNPATNLGEIPGGNKALSSGSGQVWPAQNYSEQECI